MRIETRRRTRIRTILFLLTAASVLPVCSCASFGSGPSAEEKSEIREAGDLSGIQQKLTESAEYYRGTTGDKIKAGDKTYQLDCSGAMLAVYYRAGINLEKCYSEYLGNGVKRIYSCLRDKKLIFNAKIPAVGDLIFWDNTWDRNGDGKFNDYFTHTGMVVEVQEDGTITYLHHNYRKGLVYEKMNLFRPKDKSVNSPMRMLGSPPAPEGQSLSSELVRVFGRAWQLPKSYWR